MAKTPAKKKPDDDSNPTPLDLEEIYSGEPLSAAMGVLYADLGIEGERQSFVVIHKSTEEGKEARIWKGSVEQYDLEAVSKRFGSGSYIVRVYVQREDGGFSCRGSNTFVMLLDPADEQRARELREGKTAVVAATPQVSITDIIALSDKQHQRMMDLILPVLTGAAGARQNSIADLKGMAEAFGMLAPKGDGGANDPMKMFSMFKQFMELAEGMKPEKPVTEDEIGPNSLMYKALEAFVTVAKTAKAKEAEGATMHEQPAATLPGALPAVPVPVVAMPPVQPENAEMLDEYLLKAQLKIMLNAAEKDSDVEPYAVLIYEQAPDAVIDKLQDADWFAALVEKEPRCANFQIWITRLRDRVLEMLKEDSEEPAQLTGSANATTVAG